MALGGILIAFRCFVFNLKQFAGSPYEGVHTCVSARSLPSTHWSMQTLVCLTSMFYDGRFSVFSQGSRVNLLEIDEIKDYGWFKDYACPTCRTKGEQSTRSEEDSPNHQTQNSSTNDLFAEGVYILWDTMTRSSDPKLITSTCKSVMRNVDALDDKELEEGDSQVPMGCSL